jgi:hypothetical protein
VELDCKDVTAHEKCSGKKERIVALIHKHLGLAAVASVSDVPEQKALNVKTARGSILVDYNLINVVEPH